jgi:hypothetical protein
MTRVAYLKYGEPIELPDSPSKEWYRFVGWQENPVTPKDFNEPFMPDRDLELFPKWEVID